MKKYIAILIIVQLPVLIVASQFSISNTKWMVHTEIPQSADVRFEFKTDTFRVLTISGMETGSALFFQHNDSLLIRKLTGSSPCPVGSQGWYRIEWLENGEKFYYTCWMIIAVPVMLCMSNSK